MFEPCYDGCYLRPNETAHQAGFAHAILSLVGTRAQLGLGEKDRA